MATLTGQSIASSYEQLLHVDADGGGNSTTHVSVKDGDNGTTFALTLATDAVMITSTNRLEFGDDGTYIHQSADGVLDLVSDTEIEINATDVDMNGALDLDGTFTQDAGAVVFNEAGADYDFRIEGVGEANALFVQGSDGNVGIGTASPAANNRLHVSDGSTTSVTTGTVGSILVTDDSSPRIVFEDVSSGTDKKIMLIENVSEYLGFSSANDAVTGYDVQDIMIIHRDGNVGIGKTPNRSRALEVAGVINLDDGGDVEWGDGSTGIVGNASTEIITFNTASTERMRIDSAGDVTFTGDLIMADGKGIDFSATADSSGTMTSETLDDYETGTWDAVVSDGTNPMTMNGSYDTGYYTKVGNLVTVSGQFATTSLGSASGAIRITGLPFSIANNDAAYTGGSTAYATGLAITAGHSVTFYGAISNTYVILQVWNATTGTTDMQASEWTADGRIMIGFSYRAA